MSYFFKGITDVNVYKRNAHRNQEPKTRPNLGSIRHAHKHLKYLFGLIIAFLISLSSWPLLTCMEMDLYASFQSIFLTSLNISKNYFETPPPPKTPFLPYHGICKNWSSSTRHWWYHMTIKQYLHGSGTFPDH